MEPTEIWTRVFHIVRQQLAVPTVWLAMQAARPLTIDGNYFVAGLAKQDEYLASNLQDNQASTAIEDALQSVTGRILAFRLILGETVADWEAQKGQEDDGDALALLGDDDALMPLPDALPAFQPSVVPSFSAPPPSFSAPPAAPTPPVARPPQAAAPPPRRPQAAPSTREVSPTWEHLNDRLSHGFKTAPLIKYPHGQALYVLTAVKTISDTMDVMMPPPGAPRDDQQERMLAKVIERLGSIINLDPMFLSLELFRFRESQGKGSDIPL